MGGPVAEERGLGVAVEEGRHDTSYEMGGGRNFLQRAPPSQRRKGPTWLLRTAKDRCYEPLDARTRCCNLDAPLPSPATTP